MKLCSLVPTPLSRPASSRYRCLAAALAAAILLALVPAPVADAQQEVAGQHPELQVDNFEGRPPVIVISDIGNEPDDQMSLVRFLLYSNEFDVEALIATTSTWQKTASHPETMHKLIAAYGEVRPSLLRHARGWPETALLDSRVFAGQSAYGLAATGQGKSSDGSKAILAAADRLESASDPRPLWVTIWGGAGTLAQALLDARTNRTPEHLQILIRRLRVYSISDQDDAGPWIRREFPTLFYIAQPSEPNSGEYYYATWTGISGDRYYRNGDGADFSVVTNDWLDQNIRSKGPLGKLYPRWMFIMEGDTPSYLNLIDNGLAAWQRPDFGGWGGRYVFRKPYGESHPFWTQGGDEFFRSTSQDTVTGIDGREHVSDQASIWRWRRAFQNDFAARMSWTISDFAHANHNPIVVVNGSEGTQPLRLDAPVGKPILLDATATHDPDQENQVQTLRYHWFLYAEAGTTGSNGAAINLEGENSPKATVTATSPCRDPWLPGMVPCTGGGTAHILLAVTDNGSPALTSYRRIILNIPAPAAPNKH